MSDLIKQLQWMILFMLSKKWVILLYCKDSLTDNKRKFATDKLFSEPEVIDQLKNANENRDAEFTSYSGDAEEFAKLVEEINENQK